MKGMELHSKPVMTFKELWGRRVMRKTLLYKQRNASCLMITKKSAYVLLEILGLNVRIRQV